jgi:hypothetical protein
MEADASSETFLLYTSSLSAFPFFSISIGGFLGSSIQYSLTICPKLGTSLGPRLGTTWQVFNQTGVKQASAFNTRVSHRDHRVGP